MLRSIRTARATLRSLRIYYGDRKRAAAMDRLYGNFVRPGDLVFDVGAHVGDRVASFRRLGARVVAVGQKPGRVRMLINADNPTVSTASTAFVEAAHGAPGWDTQRWGEFADVE